LEIVMNEPSAVTASNRIRIVWVIAVFAALATIAAGYLSGTTNGDIPWPATAAEESTYIASTALTGVAGALTLASLVIWGIIARPKPGRATVVIIAALVITAAVFFASYAVGTL
jgi:hypothetical protein